MGVAEQQQQRIATVSGQTSMPGHEGTFVGRISFERRDDGIYYTWNLVDSGGDFLGSLSQLVSSRVVPNNADVFEHALAHAIEGLKWYRVDRQHVYTPDTWGWKPSAT